jgi:hypothetical protein
MKFLTPLDIAVTLTDLGERTHQMPADGERDQTVGLGRFCPRGRRERREPGDQQGEQAHILEVGALPADSAMIL